MSASTSSAREVLRFWFGPEYFAEDRSQLNDEYSQRQVKRWFMGGEEMDKESRAFIPLIRDAGHKRLNGAEWASCDGLIAQMILCDQLSRNAFRGSAEAFAYDDSAVEFATQVMESPDARPGQLKWPAAVFCIVALMHSEDVQLHERVLTFGAAHANANTGAGEHFLRNQLDGALPEHTEVLRRFGRYPHRNALKGRETSPEEAAWLASDQAPGWAKSQMPKK